MTDTQTDKTEDAQKQFYPMYRVLLHNDDVNTMDHVVFALVDTFGFAVAKAVQIMLEAHTTGVALCRIEHFEHAEFHRDRLRSYSLTATIEPAD